MPDHQSLWTFPFFLAWKFKSICVNSLKHTIRPIYSHKTYHRSQPLFEDIGALSSKLIDLFSEGLNFKWGKFLNDWKDEILAFESCFVEHIFENILSDFSLFYKSFFFYFNPFRGKFSKGFFFLKKKNKNIEL